MRDKFVLAVRFQAQGTEAELYRKIQVGKELYGLSAPEYVKKILSEHFAEKEKLRETEKILQEIREEYRGMMECVERRVRQSMQEHDAVLIGALGRISGAAGASGESIGGGQEDARLPEEGGDIPEGALDFLGGF